MEKTFDTSRQQYPEPDTLEEYAEVQLVIKEFNDTVRPEEVEGRYPLRLTDSLIIIVLSGEVYIHMNYQLHTLFGKNTVQLTEEDIIQNISHSPDFTGYLLIISSGLRSEIKSMGADTRLKKAHRLKRAHPILPLDEQDLCRITERVKRMQSYLADHTHLYRSLILRNEVMNLYLDLDNNRNRKHGDGEVDLSHSELLRERFREMLVGHCRCHRNVGYYARELCVTTDYLSRVIREYDGSSAMKWIANAVVTEAKYLLRQRDKTVNQIAQELNFSDQSTFGKFFKRYTGMSPGEYKSQKYL